MIRNPVGVGEENTLIAYLAEEWDYYYHPKNGVLSSYHLTESEGKNPVPDLGKNVESLIRCHYSQIHYYSNW